MKFDIYCSGSDYSIHIPDSKCSYITIDETTNRFSGVFKTDIIDKNLEYSSKIKIGDWVRVKINDDIKFNGFINSYSQSWKGVPVLSLEGKSYNELLYSILLPSTQVFENCRNVGIALRDYIHQYLDNEIYYTFHENTPVKYKSEFDYPIAYPVDYLKFEEGKSLGMYLENLSKIDGKKFLCIRSSGNPGVWCEDFSSGTLDTNWEEHYLGSVEVVSGGCTSPSSMRMFKQTYGWPIVDIATNDFSGQNARGKHIAVVDMIYKISGTNSSKYPCDLTAYLLGETKYDSYGPKIPRQRPLSFRIDSSHDFNTYVDTGYDTELHDNWKEKKFAFYNPGDIDWYKLALWGEWQCGGWLEPPDIYIDSIRVYYPKWLIVHYYESGNINVNEDDVISISKIECDRNNIRNIVRLTGGAGYNASEYFQPFNYYMKADKPLYQLVKNTSDNGIKYFQIYPSSMFFPSTNTYYAEIFSTTFNPIQIGSPYVASVVHTSGSYLKCGDYFYIQKYEKDENLNNLFARYTAHEWNPNKNKYRDLYLRVNGSGEGEGCSSSYEWEGYTYYSSQVNLVSPLNLEKLHWHARVIYIANPFADVSGNLIARFYDEYDNLIDTIQSGYTSLGSGIESSGAKITISSSSFINNVKKIAFVWKVWYGGTIPNTMDVILLHTLFTPINIQVSGSSHANSLYKYFLSSTSYGVPLTHIPKSSIGKSYPLKINHSLCYPQLKFEFPSSLSLNRDEFYLIKLYRSGNSSIFMDSDQYIKLPNPLEEKYNQKYVRGAWVHYDTSEDISIYPITYYYPSAGQTNALGYAVFPNEESTISILEKNPDSISWYGNRYYSQSLPYISDWNALRYIADNYLESYASGTRHARITVKGDTSYTTGKYVTLNLPRLGINNVKMKIEKATHTIDRRGYLTTLTLNERIEDFLYEISYMRDLI